METHKELRITGPSGEDDPQEILKRAIGAFNQATEELKRSYDDLKVHARRLSIELEGKNRELEKSLREKEQVRNYLNNILESLTTGLVAVDAQGTIRTFNRQAENILSGKYNEAVGRELLELFPEILPRAGGWDELYSLLLKRLEYEVEIGDESNAPKHLRISSSPVQGTVDDLEGVVMIIQDITLLKRLEEVAERKNRLMYMGEMAASIAHEIRNPLGSIELFSSMLKKELTEIPDKRELAEHISTGVKNLDNIISNLLLYTKSSKPLFKEVNIHKAIDESIFSSSHLIRQIGIELKRKFNAHTPIILADEELLKQVFLNIILNAVQAMPRGGELTVSTASVKDIHNSTGSKSIPIKGYKEGILIYFKDKGIGIIREDREKIFNPFFSTKKRGMGLGLSIAHNMVEGHGGHIEIDSFPKKGTTVTIFLPVNPQ